MERKKIKVAGMFAGIGGICLSFKQAGYEIVWANEKDPASCKTYRHNFKDSNLIEGDIRNIDVNQIPDFDILTAGFPCQSFSIGGAQRGFNDRRGVMFFEVCRIIDVKRPPVIFLENVENLMKHDNGKTFLVIYTSLAQFGYAVKYKVMPTNQYGGLPQCRKRIYIVAFRDIGCCDAFKYPEPIELTQGIFNIINIHERKNDIYYYSPTSDFYRIADREINDRKYLYRVFNGEITKLKNGLCPTLTASMNTQENAAILRDDFGIRRLTLRECLDFQGFPNDYYFPKSITLEDAYKQIGNSVSVSVIKRIAETIKEACF
jgi:DNA (cytosine-5)-methyltransferase 1